MTFSLRGRSFLKESDFTVAEWASLLTLSAELKAARRARTEVPRLSGANLALIFEKTSTRTRCAFEVAAHEQGAHVTYLDGAGSQIGHKESIADTAAVLGRMFDGIQYRGDLHSTVETLAQRSGVPVWNGLTDDWHPTQSLCDVLTMREHCSPQDRPIRIAYLGDARNNVGNSLLMGCSMSGIDVRMVAPPAQQNDPEVVAAAQELAASTGGRVTVTDDVDAGVAGVDFVYTDVWVSMGEPAQVWAERIQTLQPYQINADLLARTGNPDVLVMHCLPAFHDRATGIGQALFEQFGIDGGVEITDEVFRSPASIVFDQAENRLHTIKAVMVATLS